jgi:hypothetical protein
MAVISRLRAAVAVAVAVCTGAAAPDDSQCRCLPGDGCWDSIDWAQLNASVGGRLLAFVDEMAPCIADIGSTQCNATLSNDTAYWLADQPNGLQNTALFGAWNISKDHSAYVVRAETEEDFKATTKFAHDHNLRLVVKNTGHDWFGRSAAAGSVMLWTHNRKEVKWHDEYTPPGCSLSVGPAASVQSGAQFYELYPQAQAAGRLIVGGTCDTVGVAGCWLSGCYGAFSKKFGAGALNILAARVVLANGTLVTASECSHPDLFWSLRGGGGGGAGVVTEFVVRTHPPPKTVTSMSVNANAATVAESHELFAEVLRVYSKVTEDADQAPNGGLGFDGSGGKYSININIQGYESDPAKQAALLQPVVDYVNAQQTKDKNSSVAASLSTPQHWRTVDYDPSVKWGTGNGTLPWAQFSGEKSSATVKRAATSTASLSHTHSLSCCLNPVQC